MQDKLLEFSLDKVPSIREKANGHHLNVFDCKRTKLLFFNFQILFISHVSKLSQRDIVLPGCARPCRADAFPACRECLAGPGATFGMFKGEKQKRFSSIYIHLYTIYMFRISPYTHIYIYMYIYIIWWVLFLLDLVLSNFIAFLCGTNFTRLQCIARTVEPGVKARTSDPCTAVRASASLTCLRFQTFSWWECAFQDSLAESPNESQRNDGVLLLKHQQHFTSHSWNETSWLAKKMIHQMQENIASALSR